MKTEEPARHSYQSFLMRTWWNGAGETAEWRVSLVDPVSGEQTVFTDFESLTQFLGRLLNESGPRTPRRKKKPNDS